MDTQQTLNTIFQESKTIALATSVENFPNVRIVNFVYDPGNPGVLYFASDRENAKVAEFGKNDRVAFTTVPAAGIAHVRSQNATVRKSAFSIEEMQSLFIAKIPGYDETIAAIGETLDVFEIRINEATVISGFEEPGRVSF